MMAIFIYSILNRLFLYDLDRQQHYETAFFSVMTLLLPEVWYLLYLGTEQFSLHRKLS
jgi:hypothetical protein